MFCKVQYCTTSQGEYLNNKISNLGHTLGTLIYTKEYFRMYYYLNVAQLMYAIIDPIKFTYCVVLYRSRVVPKIK